MNKYKHWAFLLDYDTTCITKVFAASKTFPLHIFQVLACLQFRQSFFFFNMHLCYSWSCRTVLATYILYSHL